jgi:hypothetical protein
MSEEQNALSGGLFFGALCTYILRGTLHLELTSGSL